MIERLKAALSDRYVIGRELGQGGMATVYLADDLKHDRKVAIKVLKPELAAVIGGERFVAEIKTTAGLQHPHILPLHDSGEADGFLYYVMPYVEGETLRDKLDREKQLGVDESLDLARDVADALDYAHRQGVIHRDIKPANILLQDGRPVVADFGIAVAISAAGGGRMTETGLSLGTPHYMSPEQATADRDLTVRSDVYSLACVLYEMLAGDPPHTGPTSQAILVRILTETPRPVSDTRTAVPPHVAAVLMKALEKLPADRFETAAEFREALDRTDFAYRPVRRTRPDGEVFAAAPPMTPAPAGSRRAGPAARLAPWGITAAAAVTALWALFLQPDPPRAPATMAQVTGLTMTQPRFAQSELAISPDGRWIVAPGRNDAGVEMLFIRSAGATEWRPIPNTENGLRPTFSPDGLSVAFSVFQAGLFRVPIDGGPAIPLVEEGNMPAWAADNTLVYTRQGAIYRMPGSGGESERIYAEDGFVASYPHLLPGGEGVLFTNQVLGDPLTGRVLYYHFGRAEVMEVAPSGVNPKYLPTGHVVFGHGGQALMAVPFDPDDGPLGAPVTVLPELSVFGFGGAAYDVSDTGTLLYNRAPANTAVTTARSFVEVDLEGNVSPIPLAAGPINLPRYSPDGRRIAYQEGGADDPEAQIRVYDIATGANPQLTDGGGRYPVWSPDGEYLYFASIREGSNSFDGYRRRADGSQPAELLYRREGQNNPRAVAPGDSLVIVRENHAERGRDLLLLRVSPDPSDAGEAVFEDFLTAEWDEIMAELSPDGRYVAYVSNQEAGEDRVFVQTFPVPTGRRSVSPGPGSEPLWAPTGDALYYRVGTTFYAVDVTTEPAFTVGGPRVLFDLPDYFWSTRNVWPLQRWDVHPDGDRFVMTVEAQTPGEAEETDAVPPGRELRDVYLVTGWFSELEERVGGGR